MAKHRSYIVPRRGRDQILFEPSGGLGTALRTVARLALGWWAVDEIARGVNPWRRMLGSAVLADLVTSLLP